MCNWLLEKFNDWSYVTVYVRNVIIFSDAISNIRGGMKVFSPRLNICALSHVQNQTQVFNF